MTDRKLAPDGTPYHAYHPTYGYPVCGAKRADGSICLRHPLRGKKRCKKHNANPLTGAANPNFRHGQYARRATDLPSLGKLVEQNLTDPDFLSLQNEIALLRARNQQLADRLERMNKRPLYAVQSARKAYKLMREAMRDPTDPDSPRKMREGMALLQKALKRSEAELDAWREVRAVMASLKALVGSEMQKQRMEEHYISNADFTLFLNMIQDIVLDEVPEAERKQRIRARFNRLLLEQKLLASGNDFDGG